MEKSLNLSTHSFIFWKLILGNFTYSFFRAKSIKFSACLSLVFTLFSARPKRYKGSFCNFEKSTCYKWLNFFNILPSWLSLDLPYLWTENYEYFFVFYPCFHNELRLFPREPCCIILSNALISYFEVLFRPKELTFLIFSWL